MDSDEEMEAPPAEYLQTRRRSNTLPKDFLSNLRARAQRAHHTPPEEETEQSETKLPYKELRKKLNKLAVDDDDTTDGLARPTCHSAKYRRSYSPSVAATPPNRSKTHRSDEKLNGKIPKSMDDIFENFLNEKKKDDIKKSTKYRPPLPRGSNLYEACLQEFGMEEEERDLISPLPSPQNRRKKHSSRLAERTQSHLEYSSPKIVHWN